MLWTPSYLALLRDTLTTGTGSDLVVKFSNISSLITFLLPARPATSRVEPGWLKLQMHQAEATIFREGATVPDLPGFPEGVCRNTKVPSFVLPWDVLHRALAHIAPITSCIKQHIQGRRRRTYLTGQYKRSDPGASVDHMQWYRLLQRHGTIADIDGWLATESSEDERLPLCPQDGVVHYVLPGVSEEKVVCIDDLIVHT